MGGTGVDAEAVIGLAEGYRPRAIRLSGVEELDGQIAKVYAIEAPGRTVGPDDAASALHLAGRQLASDRAMGSLGLGCVIVHAGGDGDYVLVHSWIEGYMSRLSIFSGPAGDPAALRPASAGLAPCVWEAEVLAHENAAFVRHLLSGEGPLPTRIDAWAADVLTVRPEENVRTAPLVRRAVRADLPEVAVMASEHAAYEKASPPAADLAERLEAVLFTEHPRLRCLVAELPDGTLAGYATCSPEFSTWQAREYLHMDCLYLREAHRGLGLGPLLVEAVVAEATALSLTEIQWNTPTWNEGAIRFYDRLGAVHREKLRYTLPTTR